MGQGKQLAAHWWYTVNQFDFSSGMSVGVRQYRHVRIGWVLGVFGFTCILCNLVSISSTIFQFRKLLTASLYSQRSGIFCIAALTVAAYSGTTGPSDPTGDLERSSITASLIYLAFLILVKAVIILRAMQILRGQVNWWSVRIKGRELSFDSSRFYQFWLGLESWLIISASGTNH